jgi:fumigaclavine B O-acetyltransferase
MKPPFSFEPFNLTQLDELGAMVFSFSLSFAVQDKEKALNAITKGIDRLLDMIPFLSGETPPAAGASGTKKGALEVRPGTAAPEEQIPMLQVKNQAGCTLPLRRIGTGAPVMPENVPINDAFHPLPGLLTPGKPTPVIRFQANVLDDGIILGVSFNHHVFGAEGGGVVLKLLAELCRNPENADMERGSRISSSQVLLRKRAFDSISLISSSYAAPTQSPPAQITKPTFSPAPAPPLPVLCECFVFSAERLEQLQTSCNALLPWLNSSSQQALSFISSNDVLVALIAACAERARGSATPSPDCWLGVNGRKFFNPALPADYMGNTNTPLRFQVQPLKQEAPSTLLDELQRQLPGINVLSFLEIATTAYTVRASLENFRTVFPQAIVSFLHPEANPAKPDVRFSPMLVNSLRSLKTYEMDFGADLGRIQTFDTGVPWLDGACVILPLCADGPDVDHLQPFNVRLSLYSDVMERFKKDQVVRWALQQEVR